MNGFLRQILALTLSFTTIFAAPVSYAQNQPATGKPVYGDVVPGIQSPGGTRVLHEGSVDSLGRPRVISFEGMDANNEPRVRYGAVEKNGAVTWDGAFNSRKAGQQYPKYPEAKARPVQPGRSLVPVGPVETHNTGGALFTDT